jgi:hypothetical protein
MKRFNRRSVLARLACLSFVASVPAVPAAAGLTTPAGRVILEASGRIKNTNQGEVAAFERAMLESLGVEKLVTDTPWSEGPVEFEGIPGDRLLEALGAESGTVLATALNDYSVEIPVADFNDNGLFFALKMNGKTLRVRDKGPIWVLYPFSDRPEINSDLFYNRSIWQLKQLEFK